MSVFSSDRMWPGLFLALALLPGLVAQPAPPPDPIEGTWLGTVTAPQGPAEIGFRFERTPRGTLVYALHFPVMNAYGVKFGAPVGRDGAAYTEPVFNTRLVLNADRLTGTFGPGQLPVELTRGGRFTAAPPPPPHPAPPAPLWSCDLGAPTWAAPVAADGTVYVGTQGGQFHAVRAGDGHKQWTWSGPHRLDGRAVVDGGAVFFVDGHNDLVCLDRADGTLRWRTALYDAALAGRPLPDNPTFNRRTASPLVLDGTVYCGSADGGLHALDAATGEKLWRHDARAPVFSGVARQGDATLLFGTMDGSVVGLDRRTRRETLRAKVGGGVVTTPVEAGGRLVVGSRDYFLYGLDPADGNVGWKFSYWFSWIESTPVLADGLIYVGSSDYRRVTAFDPATGRAVWGTDVRGMAWGSPAVTADSVFIGTVAQNLPGTVLEHTGGIVALDRRTGAVRWQLLAPPPAENAFGGWAGTLACDGERIYGAGFDGRLIALPVR